MAAAEGAACGKRGPTASGQGGPTAPCYWPDASGRSSTGGGGGGGGGQEKRRIQRNPTLDAASAQDRANGLARKTMPAEQFWKRSILMRMAEEHRNEFNEQLTWPGDHYVGGNRTWASVCSGSEGAHFVMEAIATTYPDVVFNQVFACDNRLGVRQKPD